MRTTILLTGLTVGIALALRVGGADTLSIQPALALTDYTKLNLCTTAAGRTAA